MITTANASEISTLATWAPYVAAAVALAVGVIAPAVASRTARRTARENLDHQRRLANLDRLWHKRAATYEELLTWAGVVRGEAVDEMAACVGASDAQRLRQYAEDLALPTPLDARLCAYASGSVYDASRYFVDSLKAMCSKGAELIGATSTSDAQRLQGSLLELTDFHRAVADQMTRLISDELHDVAPDDHGRATGSISLPLGG